MAVVRSLRRFACAALVAGAALAGGCIDEASPPPIKRVEDAGFVPQDGGPPGEDAAVDPDGPIGDGGIEAWAGSWRFSAGSQGVTCGGSISVMGVEGFVLITPSGPRELTLVEDGCSFRFTVVGDTATKNPAGQGCAKWAVPVIPVWTLTMQPDGTLEERLSGSVTLNGEPCTIGGRSTLVHQ
jgi:hypothetical protein